MSAPERTSILLVDDEEAILETLEYTFEDDYEVFTATNALRGLEILEANDPIEVVISDQRMPRMTGVEFFARVVERYPDTVRIILTGFADMTAIIEAINEGQIYAYIPKPWDPDQLKQVVSSAVSHHKLVRENRRLVEDLGRSNLLLESVMTRLVRGCLALDAERTIQAANPPALRYLGLPENVCGLTLDDAIGKGNDSPVADSVRRLLDGGASLCEELDASIEGKARRLRIAVEHLMDGEGQGIGNVVFFREVSHEPYRRNFEGILAALLGEDAPVRDRLETALTELRAVIANLKSAEIVSEGMMDLEEAATRAMTALQHWLDVDSAMVQEDAPEVQPLLDRLLEARRSWPLAEELPERVRQLESAVEAYCESGKNPKQPTL
jgi:CheY-like chemotaxis protein